MLVLPGGWAHATLNLRESVGVANFYSAAADDELTFRAEPIMHTARVVRSLQTAAAITEVNDFLS